MNKKTDSDIIQTVIDSLGIQSVSYFATELGYSSPSAIFHILKPSGRKINSKLILKIRTRFPEINEKFLLKTSDEVFNKEKEDVDSIAALIIEQKKTNSLLEKLIALQTNQE